MFEQEYIELKPIKEDQSYQDLINNKILKLFIQELYYPLLSILNESIKTIKNSSTTNLERALLNNRVYYAEGQFFGKFNSYISKELQELGAKWDSKNSSYKLEESKVPITIRGVIALSKNTYNEKLKQIEKTLEEMSPTKISDKLNISKILDKNLFTIEKDFAQSIKNITVEPQLTDEQREKIADEWQNNMRLYIKNFTEEQIKDLRQKVSDNVFSGIRRENLIKSFQENYLVTYNKSKFLARQETNLMMAKYKESKYVAAGIPEYKWACVKMPHQPSPQSIYKPGEVRYSHGILEGKIFSWNDPPVTTPPDQPQRRNNPGQDYRCRCFAIPILRKK